MKTVKIANILTLVLVITLTIFTLAPLRVNSHKAMAILKGDEAEKDIDRTNEGKSKDAVVDLAQPHIRGSDSDSDSDSDSSEEPDNCGCECKQAIWLDNIDDVRIDHCQHDGRDGDDDHLTSQQCEVLKQFLIEAITKACTVVDPCDICCDHGTPTTACHATTCTTCFNKNCPLLEAPKCDPNDGTCKECLTDGDCTDGTNNKCDPNGVCQQCLTNSNCNAIFPICDATSKTCRPCTADSDCEADTDGNFACNTEPGGDGTCVQCTSDVNCPDSTTPCNTDTHKCECTFCSCPSQTYCVPTANPQCAECTVDSNCVTDPASPMCINNKCGSCQRNPSVCDQFFLVCITCPADPNYGKCGPCSDDYPCTDPENQVCIDGECY